MRHLDIIDREASVLWVVRESYGGSMGRIDELLDERLELWPTGSLASS